MSCRSSSLFVAKIVSRLSGFFVLAYLRVCLSLLEPETIIGKLDGPWKSVFQQFVELCLSETLRKDTAVDLQLRSRFHEPFVFNSYEKAEQKRLCMGCILCLKCLVCKELRDNCGTNWTKRNALNLKNNLSSLAFLVSRRSASRI